MTGEAAAFIFAAAVVIPGLLVSTALMSAVGWVLGIWERKKDGFT